MPSVDLAARLGLDENVPEQVELDVSAGGQGACKGAWSVCCMERELHRALMAGHGKLGLHLPKGPHSTHEKQTATFQGQQGRVPRVTGQTRVSSQLALCRAHTHTPPAFSGSVSSSVR